MKKMFLISILALSASSAVSEPIKLVPFEKVQVQDHIWAPMTERLVTDTLPHALRQTGTAQDRLRLCAEWLESGGTTPKPYPHRFNTSDLYKVMEGAAMMLKAEPDPKIEAQLDAIIDIIGRAQKPDGYLYVSHIVGNPIFRMGETPYSFILHSHELYNVGHMYEAAVAYAQATGKTKFLDIAEKSAKHVNKVIFEGDPNYNDGKPVMQAPGHQEIEIGLVKLYNYTGNKLYLDMSKKFIDIRGVTYVPEGQGLNSPEYAQQHKPVPNQRKAVGHAVRATYMYAAMAEVDSLTGRNDYSEALNAIWHNIVDRKMHISGGLGALRRIEGFGPDYLLPNKSAYLETCAAVGNALFNMRMFLKYRDAKYVDVAEISLLNNCLSGIGLDGTSFFYPNPLEADKDHKPRSGWFGTACCPANIARLIPQVPAYMYATEAESIYSLLYGANSTTVKIGKTDVTLKQTTEYPYKEYIKFTIEPASPVEFKLHLRIPTWTGKQFVPGKLYSYTEASGEWSLKVNGKTIKPFIEKGFAVIDRQWKKNDTVELMLPMPVKVNTCIEEVKDNRNRISLTRGPLLLCAEGIDNSGKVQRFYLDPTKAAEASTVTMLQSGPLKGLPAVRVPAMEVLYGSEPKESKIKMIPYFAWSNRDRSSMIVWLGTKVDMAQPMRSNEKLKFAGVTASHTNTKDTTAAIQAKITPKHSWDGSIQRWTSWPQKGKTQWVEIELLRKAEISSVGAYFYDDKDGVQVPGSWHIEVPEGNKWKRLEIYNTDSYSSLKDNYNIVHPAGTLITDKIRLVMKPQHGDTCVGLLAVDVDIKE